MKPRSTLADRILPTQGLYRAQAVASPRAAKRRAWLYAAAAIPGLAALRHVMDPGALAVDVLALALLLGANWLLGEGLKAEDDYRARASARPPRLPLKFAAAIATGAGVATTFFSLGALSMAVYGLTAVLLHLAAFGIDPLRDKQAEGDDLGAAERIALHLAAARGWLGEIEAALAGLRDPDLTREGQGFAASVRRLLALAQKRPGSLGQIREHLGVLLHGARDATIRLADVWDGPGRRAAKADYLRFLADLTASYEDRAKLLDSALHQEMTLEMEVVRDRLRRGTHPESED